MYSVVRVRCRRKESSRSLSHLLVSFFLVSQCTRLTDRKTDRQISTARPCVCFRTRTFKMCPLITVLLALAMITNHTITLYWCLLLHYAKTFTCVFGVANVAGTCNLYSAQSTAYSCNRYLPTILHICTESFK